MAEVVDVIVPVPGIIASVEVKPGDKVKSGSPIVVLQAMKMEIPVEAEVSGQVKEILVEPGQDVEAGSVVARIVRS